MSLFYNTSCKKDVYQSGYLPPEGNALWLYIPLLVLIFLERGTAERKIDGKSMASHALGVGVGHHAALGIFPSASPSVAGGVVKLCEIRALRGIAGFGGATLAFAFPRGVSQQTKVCRNRVFNGLYVKIISNDAGSLRNQLLTYYKLCSLNSSYPSCTSKKTPQNHTNPPSYPPPPPLRFAAPSSGTSAASGSGPPWLL